MKKLFLLLLIGIIFSCTNNKNYVDVPFEFNETAQQGDSLEKIIRKEWNNELTLDQKIELTLRSYYIKFPIRYRSIVKEDLDVDLKSFLFNFDTWFITMCKDRGIDYENIPDDYFGPTYPGEHSKDYVAVYQIKHKGIKYNKRSEYDTILITNEDELFKNIYEEDNEWKIQFVYPMIKRKFKN